MAQSCRDGEGMLQKVCCTCKVLKVAVLLIKPVAFFIDILVTVAVVVIKLPNYLTCIQFSARIMSTVSVK